MAPVRVLTRGDVERLLSPAVCVAAVEDAFRRRGEGHDVRSAVVGLGVEGGGFHVKVASMEVGRRYFAMKVNANFPDNPALRGLPTIQGVLALFDATTGAPLALMDSIAITILRTAAATAVAARYLALGEARCVTLVGCGAQALAQLRALDIVRELEQVFVLDTDAARRGALAEQARTVLGIDVVEATDLARATRESEIIVTCTPSRRAYLGEGHVMPGTFVAAVGADSEHKQELHPELLARAAVVVDSLEQCAAIGDLHHAIEAGLLTRDDVRAELSEVVAHPERGRRSPDEIVVFDSTGVAFEDVAAAAVVFEGAERDGAGTSIALAD
jgi:alanine dehydrogenase